MQHFLSKQRAFEDNTLNTTQKGVFLWLWAGSQHNRHFFFAQITPQAHRGCLWVSGLSAAKEEDWPALHHPCPVRLSVGGFALSTFYVFVKPLFLWSTSLWRRAACFQSSNSFMLRKQALTCSLRIKLLCFLSELISFRWEELFTVCTQLHKLAQENSKNCEVRGRRDGTSSRHMFGCQTTPVP